MFVLYSSTLIAQELTQEDRSLKQHFYPVPQPQIPPPSMSQTGRPVTGNSPKIQPPFMAPPVVQVSLAQQISNMQQQTVNKPTSGRAIVGGNSIQQQAQIHNVLPAQSIDVLRMLDLQRMQQMVSLRECWFVFCDKLLHSRLFLCNL